MRRGRRKGGAGEEEEERKRRGRMPSEGEPEANGRISYRAPLHSRHHAQMPRGQFPSPRVVYRTH